MSGTSTRVFDVYAEMASVSERFDHGIRLMMQIDYDLLETEL